MVRSAAQMSASGRSRVCHRLYARMCCGRGRSPGCGWVADCVLVVVVWLEEVLLMLAPEEEEGGRANGFQPADVVLVNCVCGSDCCCVCVCVGASVDVGVGVEASSSGSLSSICFSAAGDEAVGAVAAALALAAVFSR